MPGADTDNESLFSTVKLEDFAPAKHPLRLIRNWLNDALTKMDTKFSAMYEADIKGWRPSIAPEKLSIEAEKPAEQCRKQQSGCDLRGFA